jgi:hypothetical protein
MKDNKMSKAAAAFELEEEIANMQLALDKAKAMMTDVVDNYFGAYSDPKDHEEILCIAQSFRRNGTYAQIAMDYLYQASDMVKALLSQAAPGTKVA